MTIDFPPRPDPDVIRGHFPDTPDPLKKGGGGGTFDGMDQRGRQLENDMSFLKGKLDDMPTKDWMTTRLFWVVGAFVAISTLVQIVLSTVAKLPLLG